MAAPLTDKDGKDIFDEKKRHMPLIPGVWAMTERIVTSISDSKFKNALDTIKEELRDAEREERKKDSTFMLENIISSMDQKLRVIGKGSLCGLNKEQLKELRLLFQKEIKTLAAVHNNKDINFEQSCRLHFDFARWIRYAARK